MRNVLLFLSLFLGLFVAATSIATPSGDVVSPDQVVRQTSVTVLHTLNENETKYLGHPERVYEVVDRVLKPVFDFDYAARMVLGRYWRTASKEQRANFIDAFTHYLVNSYADVLVEHSDATVKVLPFRGSSTDRRADVTTLIITPTTKKPLKVIYAMVRTNDGWKVFDVRSQGVSFVMSYRNSFGAEIRKKGLDELIKRLQEKAHAKAQNASHANNAGAAPDDANSGEQ